MQKVVNSLYSIVCAGRGTVPSLAQAHVQSGIAASTDPCTHCPPPSLVMLLSASTCSAAHPHTAQVDCLQTFGFSQMKNSISVLCIVFFKLRRNGHLSFLSVREGVFILTSVCKCVSECGGRAIVPLLVISIVYFETGSLTRTLCSLTRLSG